jgi:hypothetical protein
MEYPCNARPGGIGNIVKSVAKGANKALLKTGAGVVGVAVSRFQPRTHPLPSRGMEAERDETHTGHK